MLGEYLFEQVCVSQSKSRRTVPECHRCRVSGKLASHILYLCHLCRLFRYVSCSSAAGLNHSLTLIHIPPSLGRGIINLEYRNTTCLSALHKPQIETRLTEGIAKSANWISKYALPLGPLRRMQVPIWHVNVDTCCLPRATLLQGGRQKQRAGLHLSF